MPLNHNLQHRPATAPTPPAEVSNLLTRVHQAVHDLQRRSGKILGTRNEIITATAEITYNLVVEEQAAPRRAAEEEARATRLANERANLQNFALQTMVQQMVNGDMTTVNVERERRIANMSAGFNDLFLENAILKQENADLTESNARLEAQVAALLAENASLKAIPRRRAA